MLTVLALSFAIWAPPGHPTSEFCSRIAILHFRTAEVVYFLGEALPDTIEAGHGNVTPESGQGHSGASRRRAVFGQALAVSRVGSPWRELLPAGAGRVVLVPWDYGAGCEPLYWSRSARWIRPGTRGLFHATIRPRDQWVGGVPTLDVFGPEFTPYPASNGVQRDLGFARQEPDSVGRVLDAAEYLTLVEALPRYDSLAQFPAAAVQPLYAWARQNPALSRAWPATEILRIVRLEADEAAVRQFRPPMAGTYRVVVLFGSGDSSVLYARTEAHPMSAIRERTEADVRRRDKDLYGYYLNAYVANSVAALAANEERLHSSYFGASLEPVKAGADSTVWRGELSPIVEVTFLDPRPAIRALAESTFGASDELRDPTSYFLPGTWVMYPNGATRFEWRLTKGSRLVYLVRAERISTVTSTRQLR